MPPSDGERLATIEQVLRDVRDDVHDLRKIRENDHSRLRQVESALGAMLEVQKEARRQEGSQYRRIEVKLQWLALAIGLAAVLVTVALGVWGH